MTKAKDNLLLAAQAYADAKRAIDEFEGDRRGEDFAAACRNWREATTGLARAARAAGGVSPRLALVSGGAS